MKLGQTYTKKEIKELYTNEYSNHSYVYGVTLDKVFFIKFAEHEFYEKEDNVFLYVKNAKEDLSNNNFGTAIKLASNTTSRSYYERDTKAAKEAKKYGYQKNG